MSTLKVNTIRNSADVEQYLCKAWVNFNGTGTVAIRAAGNVSSITDHGAGDYTVNLTTALPDINYSVSGCGATATGEGATSGVDLFEYLAATSSLARTTNSIRVRMLNNSNTLSDCFSCSVAIFR